MMMLEQTRIVALPGHGCGVGMGSTVKGCDVE